MPNFLLFLTSVFGCLSIFYSYPEVGNGKTDYCHSLKIQLGKQIFKTREDLAFLKQNIDRGIRNNKTYLV